MPGSKKNVFSFSQILKYVQSFIVIILTTFSILVSLGIKIPVPMPLLIVIVLSCFLASFVITGIQIKKETEREADIEEFHEGSPEFTRFFKKWYNKHGTLSIFCSDLEWMTKDIIKTISKRKGKSTVYLRDTPNPETKKTLEDVHIISINPKLTTKHSFSLLEVDNIASLIIKEKKGGSDKIQIKKEDSTKNPYIINLVKDLLDYINEKEKNE